MKKNIIFSGLIASSLSLLLLILLPGCGEKQTIGTGTGALVGHAVSGKKSRGVGTLLGALAGNIIGSAIDQEEEKVKDQRRRTARAQRDAQRAKVERLEDENHHLKKHAIRQCPYHGRVKIVGATRCPECGTKTTRVFTKKHCAQCGKTFPKKAKFCAFCPNKIRLNAV